MKSKERGRGMRADAIRNRRKVVEAAHRVFCEYGPEISIREVAKEAGVGLGTIYRHFPDKEALLASIVEERFGFLSRQTREAMDTLEPWEAFARVMRLIAEMMNEDRALAGAIMSPQPVPPRSEEGTLIRERNEARRELDVVLRELAESAKLAGELRKDVGPKELGLLFAGVAMSFGAPPGEMHPPSEACAPVEQPQDERTERPWERYLDVILDGLRESSRGAAIR